MRRFTRKQRITAVGVVVVLATAGTAFAFWTGGGSGSGDATAGTSATVTLTATIAPGIAPGTSRVVSFTATNLSASPIAVTTVHLDSIAADSDHSACVMADFTMADVSQLNPTLPYQVAAGATVLLPNSGSLVYANTAVSQDACKGATLTLTLSST